MTDENIPVESLENEGTDTQPHAVFDDAITHHLRGMYRSWYLEYASYVILERAVPHIDDGLKPVLSIQCRLLTMVGSIRLPI